MTFGRAYTEVIERFFGSDKTSSSDDMEEEGEEEKDSSSSSDKEVQKDMPPSPVTQTPVTSKKQIKKSDTRDSSSLNVLRERFKQNNMADPLHIFLPITIIECLPVDPNTGKITLEDSWVKANAESYTYWFLGGTHSLLAKQTIAAEYEHVDTYKMAMCWVYAGLTDDEAKVLALDHNIDSDFRLEMTFIQKIRFFHNEKKGGRGSSQKPNTKKYDNYFQFAFRDGEIWDLQEEIFKLHEQGKLKGQKLSKSHAPSRGKGASKEDSPKPIPEDMKITPWRQLQGIREKSLIVAISPVKGGSISLEQMGEELERQKTMLHMQRIMIEKLNCSNWDEVVHYHPDTSKPHGLEKYMLLFASTVRGVDGVKEGLEHERRRFPHHRFGGLPCFQNALSIRDRYTLLGAKENPVLTARKKLVSMHERWEVCKGEHFHDDRLLSTVKKTSMMQFKTHLTVFLTGNVCVCV
ncbi:hypothetical protein L7F22_015107 [Adiantum nelumboides]|nr:hypothetical protein [Adiantum nelumboides]